jgi:hypothetical protein
MFYGKKIINAFSLIELIEILELFMCMNLLASLVALLTGYETLISDLIRNLAVSQKRSRMEDARWGVKRRRSSVEETPSAPCVSQPRAKGGVWAKAGPAVSEYRSVNERLKATNTRLLQQLESQRVAATAETQRVLGENSQLLAALQSEQGKQELLKTRIRGLRRKNLMLVAAQAGKQSAEKTPRQMRGGSSIGVKVKTAAVVDNFIAKRFATQAARQ